MQENKHTACCTLYKNKRACLCSGDYFLSGAAVYFFFLLLPGSQLVRQCTCVYVCVRVASPGVGGSALVMHGCAHLFDTGDASPPSPRPQDGWGRRNSSIGAPGGDPAPLGATAPAHGSIGRAGRTVQWLKVPFEQGTEPPGDCDRLPYLRLKL